MLTLHKCRTADAPDGWIDCACPIGHDHDESEMDGEWVADEGMRHGRPPEPSDLSEVAMELMRAELKADQWDVPPLLIAILQRDDDYDIEPLLLPNELWAMGQVYEVLYIIIALVKRTPPPEGLIDAMVGLALLNEGYGLVNPTTEEVEWAKHHSIADHPKGREAKMLTLVDLATRKLQYVNAWRGGEPEDADEGTAEGRVPEALLTLAKVLRP